MGVLGVCYEFDNVANTGSVYVRDKKAKNIGERNVYERGVIMFEAAIIGLGWWGSTITRTLKKIKQETQARAHTSALDFRSKTVRSTIASISKAARSWKRRGCEG